MQRTYFDHPGIDALERFVLHKCSEEELELVETHFLACESCVCTLENLEIEIASAKLALQEIANRPVKSTKRERAFAAFSRWFTVPNLAWAGAGLAACAFCLFAFVPADITLKADRDNATIVVPEWRKTNLTLSSEGLPAGPLKAEIVNESGATIWSGGANRDHGQVNVSLPRMTHEGIFYARLYTANQEHDLLAEFRFEVK